MKRFKEYVNEGVRDQMTPKSKEEIRMITKDKIGVEGDYIEVRIPEPKEIKKVRTLLELSDRYNIDIKDGDGDNVVVCGDVNDVFDFVKFYVNYTGLNRQNKSDFYIEYMVKNTIRKTNESVRNQMTPISDDKKAELKDRVLGMEPYEKVRLMLRYPDLFEDAELRKEIFAVENDELKNIWIIHTFAKLFTDEEKDEAAKGIIKEYFDFAHKNGKRMLDRILLDHRWRFFNDYKVGTDDNGHNLYLYKDVVFEIVKERGGAFYLIRTPIRPDEVTRIHESVRDKMTPKPEAEVEQMRTDLISWIKDVVRKNGGRVSTGDVEADSSPVYMYTGSVEQDPDASQDIIHTIETLFVDRVEVEYEDEMGGRTRNYYVTYEELSEDTLLEIKELLEDGIEYEHIEEGVRDKMTPKSADDINDRIRHNLRDGGTWWDYAKYWVMGDDSIKKMIEDRCTEEEKDILRRSIGTYMDHNIVGEYTSIDDFKDFPLFRTNEGVRDLMTPIPKDKLLKKLSRDTSSPTGLLVNSVNKGVVEGVVEALRRGADLHWNNDWCFVRSCMKGYVDIVRVLIEEGADIHVMDDTASYWADIYSHGTITAMLENEMTPKEIERKNRNVRRIKEKEEKRFEKNRKKEERPKGIIGRFKDFIR